MNRKLYLSLFLVCYCVTVFHAQPEPEHNLVFPEIPRRWDEGLPLGNGILGCLVWQKEGRLRLSLDRADLWDERPMKGLNRPEFNYRWVAEHVASGDYGIVQEYFDAPYEREPGPTKLPGAALEFAAGEWGAGHSELDLGTGLVTLSFPGKLIFKTFVHASRREGWFRLEGLAHAVPPELRPPPYAGKREAAASGSVQGDDLSRLGYHQSDILSEKQMLVYHQPCWGGYSYEVAVTWRYTSSGLEGVWCISSHFPQKPGLERSEKAARRALKRGFERSLEESKDWWTGFWAKSSVQVPDTMIERQYYRDLYKFGCTARPDAPMISLQAVWTADNGRLPPWKGDLHHDLNTQMSYWPAYTSNHLNGARGYLNHLESNQEAHLRYTNRFFGTSGLAIPGVETLLGEPMGGWIQYACSPTASAWLAQHFYLQWRYNADPDFLRWHAYPMLKMVATHLEELCVRTPEGRLKLPISSSPEIGDNRREAWFLDWTNYDLALTRFTFRAAAQMAEALGQRAGAEYEAFQEAAAHWRALENQLPAYSADADGALRFAPTLPYRESHRHFSHLMAIHPLGLIDWNDGPEAQQTIRATLQSLDNAGTKQWTGYSFAWLANVKARARDGDGARKALRVFAEAFVSANSFHVNGDQSGKAYSDFTYRPFTLEGNFASAAGLLEMLLQSSRGIIEVFPAVPADWSDVSFKNLRAEGAFLVSAARKNGKTQQLSITSEQGGDLNIRLPAGLKLKDKRPWGDPPSESGGVLRISTRKGETLLFE